MRKTKLFIKIICVLILILSTALLSACSASTSDSTGKYVVLIGEDSEITEKLSDIDLLVIDAEYFSQNDIARLRENGVREIYSYIEKYTLGAYENWPEEKWIDVSAPEWQACTASRVDALVQKGVDGFFVDNTDVYYNYPQESIYDGILTILDYMNHTGRKIMINGGVNQENVFTAYDFSKDIYTINDKSTREYYTDYLDFAMSHGCTAYTLEYATVPAIRRQAAAYAGKHGYICCISDNIGLCLEKYHIPISRHHRNVMTQVSRCFCFVCSSASAAVHRSQ